MIIGDHPYRLDSKGRLTLPRKFRPYLGDVVIVTRGLDKCLWVFPKPEWEKVVTRLDALPLSSRDARRARRWIIGSAHELEPDRAGRILIPPTLREYAGIRQEVIVAGLHTYLEIWAAEAWQEEMEKVAENEIVQDSWASNF